MMLGKRRELMVDVARIELAAFRMPSERSTTELHARRLRH